MIIPTIQDKLKKYPHLTWTTKNNYLEIPAQAPTGFKVWIEKSSSGFTVGFEGWHETFSDSDDALNCFAFGLSPDCRLRLLSRGGTDYKWQVFHYQDGEWIMESETGLLFFPFWRRKAMRELQNNIIPST